MNNSAISNVISLIKVLIPSSVRKHLRKIFKKSFKPYIRRMNVEDVVFDFLVGDAVGQRWYANVNSLSPEMRFIRDNIIEDGDIVLDCGAHHGYTTILFANWVGDKGKVVAFEASPSSARILQSNIELNGLQNAVVEQKAVSSREGRICISGGSNSRVIPGKLVGVEVEATYLDKYSHLKPTFLKVDVEGFEIEVLKGAQEILKSKPKLAIEVHVDMLRNYNSAVEDLFSLIDEEGYTFWIQFGGKDEPHLYDGSSISHHYEPQVHLYAMPKR